MNTILIPITSRQLARNILRTGAFAYLQSNSDLRLVVLVPSIKIEDYKKEFKNDNVVFEGVPSLPPFISRLDMLFGRLALFYTNSPTARFLRKQWLLLERKSPIRYAVSISLLSVIGNLRILRAFLRYLDYHLVRDERFLSYL